MCAGPQRVMVAGLAALAWDLARPAPLTCGSSPDWWRRFGVGARVERPLLIGLLACGRRDPAFGDGRADPALGDPVHVGLGGAASQLGRSRSASSPSVSSSLAGTRLGRTTSRPGSSVPVAWMGVGTALGRHQPARLLLRSPLEVLPARANRVPRGSRSGAAPARRGVAAPCGRGARRPPSSSPAGARRRVSRPRWSRRRDPPPIRPATSPSASLVLLPGMAAGARPASAPWRGCAVSRGLCSDRGGVRDRRLRARCVRPAAAPTPSCGRTPAGGHLAPGAGSCLDGGHRTRLLVGNYLLGPLRRSPLRVHLMHRGGHVPGVGGRRLSLTPPRVEPGWQDVLTRHRAGVVLWPKDKPLTPLLQAQPGLAAWVTLTGTGLYIQPSWGAR